MKASQFETLNRLLSPIDRGISKLIENKAKNINIIQPIFIIGAERSGTTLVYSILSNSDQLYWFSRLDTVLPECIFFTTMTRKFVQIFQTKNEIYRALPGVISKSEGGFMPPSECVSYWRLIFRFGNDNNYLIQDDYADETQLTDELGNRIITDFKKRIYLSNKKRLMFKQPGLSLRIKFLNALFPDALFLHCVRNPTQNIVSMVEAKKKSGEKYWGTKVPGWKKWIEADLFAQAANQIEKILNIIERDIKTIDNWQQRYMCIKLEDIRQKPKDNIEKVLNFCKLSFTPEILKSIDYITERDSKEIKEFLQDIPLNVTKTIKRLALKYGYAI